MVITEKLNDLGFNWEQLDTDIYYIHNFATAEELAFCYNFCVSATEEEWSARYLETIKQEGLQKFGRDDVDNLIAEGLIDINEEWIDRTLQLQGELPHVFARRIQDFLTDDLEATALVGIQRHYPGASLAEHIDAETSEHLRYAAVFYINDDFNGGRLYFPKRNLTIEPRAGSLIIFPTGRDYLHGVGVVEPGPTRYAIANFVWTRGYEEKAWKGEIEINRVHKKVEE
jgi:hypothetical protein